MLVMKSSKKYLFTALCIFICLFFSFSCSFTGFGNEKSLVIDLGSEELENRLSNIRAAGDETSYYLSVKLSGAVNRESVIPLEKGFSSTTKNVSFNINAPAGAKIQVSALCTVKIGKAEEESAVLYTGNAEHIVSPNGNSVSLNMNYAEPEWGTEGIFAILPKPDKFWYMTKTSKTEVYDGEKILQTTTTIVCRGSEKNKKYVEMLEKWEACSDSDLLFSYQGELSTEGKDINLNVSLDEDTGALILVITELVFYENEAESFDEDTDDTVYKPVNVNSFDEIKKYLSSEDVSGGVPYKLVLQDDIDWTESLTFGLGLENKEKNENACKVMLDLNGNEIIYAVNSLNNGSQEGSDSNAAMIVIENAGENSRFTITNGEIKSSSDYENDGIICANLSADVKGTDNTGIYNQNIKVSDVKISGFKGILFALNGFAQNEKDTYNNHLTLKNVSVEECKTIVKQGCGKLNVIDSEMKCSSNAFILEKHESVFQKALIALVEGDENPLILARDGTMVLTKNTKLTRQIGAIGSLVELGGPENNGESASSNLIMAGAKIAAEQGAIGKPLVKIDGYWNTLIMTDSYEIPKTEKIYKAVDQAGGRIKNEIYLNPEDEGEALEADSKQSNGSNIGLGYNSYITGRILMEGISGSSFKPLICLIDEELAPDSAFVIDPVNVNQIFQNPADAKDGLVGGAFQVYEAKYSMIKDNFEFSSDDYTWSNAFITNTTSEFVYNQIESH